MRLDTAQNISHIAILQAMCIFPALLTVILVPMGISLNRHFSVQA